jgi:hypothetical protein
MDEHQASDFPFLEPLRRYVPLVAWAVVILVILAIPFKVLEYGYLPADDALRHAAKAVSGKPWSDILVLNHVYQIDHEFGWNLLLERIHRWADWDAEKLVMFSVVGLFLLTSVSVLSWLKRPEAWLITLTAAMIVSYIPQLFLIGRPFLVTVSALMTLLLMWQCHGASPPKAWMVLLMACLIAVSTYVHGVWYLWVLVGAAFFLAGQIRWGLAFGASWVVGVVAGSALTGHPLAYPMQAIKLALLATGMHTNVRTMVPELQPSGGDILALIMLGGLLILRQLARLNARPWSANPAFWLLCFTWVLGFKVARFWDDWGWPALMVLMVSDLQLLLLARLAVDSFKRLGLVCVLAATTYLCVTSDLNSRWSGSLVNQYLTADNPDLKGWMPDKDGIFYTVDMSLFYQTFYKNPKGDWRYMLGFEPTWMPREDFDVYCKVIWNFGDGKAYDPWVDKMRPEDRLVIRGGRGSPPNIPKLEWNYGVSGIWIGRLPRAQATPGEAPATVPAKAR